MLKREMKMGKKDALRQELDKMKGNWKKIEESMERIYTHWKGEAAESHQRLFETGVKRPLMLWMEELEDETEEFFGEE